MFLVMSFLIGYTDGMLDPQVGSNIGFLLIGIILLNVAINFLLFIYATGKLIYLKVVRPLIRRLTKAKLSPTSDNEFASGT